MRRLVPHRVATAWRSGATASLDAGMGFGWQPGVALAGASEGQEDNWFDS